MAKISNKPGGILVVAGEASGDEHAARLVAAIKDQSPQAEFFGIGGEALAAQGVRLLCPASELAVVGLWEVAGRLGAVMRALWDVGRVLKSQEPALAILVDFPDFNFWVARLARYYRVPVMYYISPQVWAWRSYRVRTLARLVDRLAVIFPFEADFYRERGVPATYVGHPLLETLPPPEARRSWLARVGLEPGRLTVALLPGSRAGEIECHLPGMLKAAALIRQAIPPSQFILPVASTAPWELVQKLVGEFEDGLRAQSQGGLILKTIQGQSFQVLSAAHLAMVASGTATLEAALAGTPMVIVYRLSPLSYRVGRLLIRVEHVGMANLLAGERLFPELIQEDFTPDRLAREALGWIGDRERLAALGPGLARIVRSLEGLDASQRAAQVALELMAGGKKIEKIFAIA